MIAMNQFYEICHKMVKIFTGLLWGILFGVFFVSGLAFLAGRQIYYETSDSMSPVIEKGSLLFVKEKDTTVRRSALNIRAKAYTTCLK